MKKFQVEVITDDCDIQTRDFEYIEEALLRFVLEMQKTNWHSIYVWEYTEDGIKPYTHVKKMS